MRLVSLSARFWSSSTGLWSISTCIGYMSRVQISPHLGPISICVVSIYTYHISVATCTYLWSIFTCILVHSYLPSVYNTLYMVNHIYSVKSKYIDQGSIFAYIVSIYTCAWSTYANVRVTCQGPISMYTVSIMYPSMFKYSRSMLISTCLSPISNCLWSISSCLVFIYASLWAMATCIWPDMHV